MSKISDILNKNFTTESKNIDFAHDELVETFFGLNKKKVKEKKAPKASRSIVVILVFLVLFIIILGLIIDIKITVKENVKDAARNIVASAKANFLLKDGKPNQNLVKKVTFLGDARKFSRATGKIIVLINAKGSGWGNMSIKFKKPINIRDLDISYMASGQSGGERMFLILIDANNRLYRIQDNLALALNKEWKSRRISLQSAQNAIDLSRISEMQFEFGSLTTGNSTGATIFLRDINTLTLPMPKDRGFSGNTR